MQEASARFPGRRALEDADGVATRAIDNRRSGLGGLALARADGAVAARRRLHVRLDREPARPRHAQRRSRPSRVPASRRSATRSASARTGCGSSGWSRSTCSPGARQDGNWVWTFILDRARWLGRGCQPQPLPAADPRRPVGMMPMEPASLRHGAQDAARDQAALGGVARARRLSSARGRVRGSSSVPSSLGCSGGRPDTKDRRIRAPCCDAQRAGCISAA